MSSKAQSVLSYVGILWLVAYLLGKDQRDDDNRYHLKQGLGLQVLGILFSIVVFIVGLVAPVLAKILGFGGFLFVVLMIFGIIHVVDDVKRPLPVIGKLFERSFTFIDRQ